MDVMENCLAFHRRWNDHLSRGTVFPFTDSNVVKVEHKPDEYDLEIDQARLGERLEELQVLDSLVEHFWFQKDVLHNASEKSQLILS
jgi:hypothetical protein